MNVRIFQIAAVLMIAVAAGLFAAGVIDGHALETGAKTAMFIGPCYDLVNNGVSISTAITPVQLKAGVNGMVEIMRAELSQGSTPTSAQLAGALLRKTAAATVTLGVAGTTVLKQNPINPTTDASLGTSATGITASAEGTNGEIFAQAGFNDLNGWVWLPAQEERMAVPQAGIVGLTYLTAPQSATRYARISFRELRAS